MSASPAQPPSGPNSVTPTTGGPPAPVPRKRPVVNIFNTSTKKKVIRRPPPAGQRPSASTTQVSNGPPLHPKQQPRNDNVRPQNAQMPAASDEPDPSTYDEFPIMITKSQLNQGLRYHAMKLQSRLDATGQPISVNPYDEKQFVRPVRLHRRYARDKMMEEQSEPASGVDDKEREILSARRAERQAEREENQKLIAPTGGDTAKPHKKRHQKKVEEGRDESNPARKKRQQIRYEEARPWHLEDFEGKNIWVSTYEEALSERSIMLEVSTNGTFQMVPVEKWYKFTQTNKVNAMDSEEVEKFMTKKHVPGRWAMGTQKAAEEARLEEYRRRLAGRRAALDDDEEEPKAEDVGEFDADRDMLDLDVKDEFQDDDEGILFQGEDGEDADDIERRLYLEMRDAGLGGTGVKDDDKDVVGELHKEQLAKLEEKKRQRRIRKQLRKREHQGQYSDSDSDDPYKDSSESDSDEEREEEERKKEEEAKKAALNGDKSGASTRGTNTPNDRPEKRDQVRLASNKRPGSPDASDLSGNESSRKKIKSINGRPLTAAPTNKARALSPADAQKPKGSGSGSDTDTSRTGRPKLKLKNKSQPGSPATATPNGSRAGSPAASGTRTPVDATSFPAPEELRPLIPADGIIMKELITIVKAKHGKSYAKSRDFGQALRLVGQLVTRLDADNKEVKRIMPRV